MRLRVRVTNLFCLFIATALAGTGWIVKAEALTAGHATAHIIGVKVALAGIADFTGAGGDRHRITAYGHGRSFQLYWVKENHSTLQYRCNIFILNNLHLTKHVSCALCTVFRMGGVTAFRVHVTVLTTTVVCNVTDGWKREKMALGKFISYLRVSTQRQGKSGLGLEAQREAVANYLNGGRWKLVQELIEVESGKSKDRPKLIEALRLCRIYNATLLVAKLDRLARNVAFVSALMESGVKFVAVDLPQANELTVHIMAAMAEYEAKAISARTKAALEAAKARGTRLGGLRWDLASVSEQGRAMALKVRKESAENRASDLMPVIESIKAEGATSLRQIAAVLNVRGITTARGGEWSAVQVQRRMGRP